MVMIVISDGSDGLPPATHGTGAAGLAKFFESFISVSNVISCNATGGRHSAEPSPLRCTFAVFNF